MNTPTTSLKIVLKPETLDNYLYRLSAFLAMRSGKIDSTLLTMGNHGDVPLAVN